jgi:hypothetical protein
MRRLMLLLVAVSFLGFMTGCRSSQCGGCGSGGQGGHGINSHGVCDCEFDDHCFERAPWTRYAPPATSAAEPIGTPPTKMPDGKRL